MLTVLTTAFSIDLLSPFLLHSLTSPIGIALVLGILKVGSNGTDWEELNYPPDEALQSSLHNFSVQSNILPIRVVSKMEHCANARQKLSDSYLKSIAKNYITWSTKKNSEAKICQFQGMTSRILVGTTVDAPWNHIARQSTKSIHPTFDITGWMLHYSDEEWTYFGIPMNSSIGLWIFVPNPKNDIDQIRARMRADLLRERVMNAQEEEIRLTMPVFSLSTDMISIDYVMKFIKSQKVFDKTLADLPLISSVPHYAFDAKYAANITVSESGINCVFEAEIGLRSKKGTEKEKGNDQTMLSAPRERVHISRDSRESGKEKKNLKQKQFLSRPLSIESPFLFMVIYDNQPIFSGWNYPNLH